jgi:hypothetical protein
MKNLFYLEYSTTLNMKKVYFMLLIVAVIAAPAVKGQVNPLETANVPDSVRALADYYDKLLKMEQYQKEKRKLESSIRAGDVLLAVHVMPRSFFKEDSGKNVIVAFINEEWKTRPKIAYIVRFDSAHNILSVNKHHSMTSEERALALGTPKKQRE